MKRCLATVFLSALFCGCTAVAPVAPAESERAVYYCNGLRVVQDFLADNPYNRQYKMPGEFEKVKYITIHNTANKATAQNERDYLNNRRDHEHISFQFAVDENEAIQIMPMTARGWHAGDGRGDGNTSSIAIEICRSTSPDKELYRRSEENAVKLAAWLLTVNNLTIDDLRMHQHWSGKNCPHRILDEGRWEEFKARVAESKRKLDGTGLKAI